MKQNIDRQGELFNINKIAPKSPKEPIFKDHKSKNGISELSENKSEDTKIYKIIIGENSYEVQENYRIISVCLKDTYRGLFRIINNKIEIHRTINYKDNKYSYPIPINILNEMYRAVGVYNKMVLAENNH